MNKQTILINSRKFDGKIHRSWSAELISETDQILSFVGVFDVEVKHEYLGVIRRGTVSYEYYWKNKWFNVFRFHEPGGDFRNFYCNINQPPRFENGILDYIDLDVDILVWGDFTRQTLDLAEFEQNAKKYKYPENIRIEVKKGLAELDLMILNREFPFNY